MNRVAMIDATLVAQGRCIAIRMAEVAMPSQLFREILQPIDGLRA